MRRLSERELLKRLARAEATITPPKPKLHERIVVDGWVCTRGAPGGKWFVFPEIKYKREEDGRLVRDLEAWEAVAAPEQAKLIADARADIEMAVAEERPEGEPPIYLRPRSRR